MKRKLGLLVMTLVVVVMLGFGALAPGFVDRLAVVAPSVTLCAIDGGGSGA